MSAKNPRKAMAALLPLAVKCPCGETVRPLTLGMYAALERIGSPLVTGAVPKDALELIPSLYLLTHDPREVLASGFFDAAVAWADTLPVTALGEIRDACYRQMDAMGDVLPEEKKRPAAERRLDRVARPLGGEGVRLGFRGNPLGYPRQRARAPQAAAPARRRQNLPAL